MTTVALREIGISLSFPFTQPSRVGRHSVDPDKRDWGNEGSPDCCFTTTGIATVVGSQVQAPCF
jgi:hypothetical protein